MLVRDAHREAVDFRLHDISHVVSRPSLRQPRMPGPQFRLGVNLVEAEHRFAMPVDGKQAAAVVADRRSRGLRFRRERPLAAALQRSQFALEPVVRGIGNFRRRLVEIKSVMVRDLLPQFGDAMQASVAVGRVFDPPGQVEDLAYSSALFRPRTRNKNKAPHKDGQQEPRARGKNCGQRIEREGSSGGRLWQFLGKNKVHGCRSEFGSDEDNGRTSPLFSRNGDD